MKDQFQKCTLSWFFFNETLPYFFKKEVFEKEKIKWIKIYEIYKNI